MIATQWLASLAAYAGVFLVVFIPLSFISHRFSESGEKFAHRPAGPGAGHRFRRGAGLVIVGLAYIGLYLFRAGRTTSPRWFTQPAPCR